MRGVPSASGLAVMHNLWPTVKTRVGLALKIEKRLSLRSLSYGAYLWSNSLEPTMEEGLPLHSLVLSPSQTHEEEDDHHFDHHFSDIDWHASL